MRSRATVRTVAAAVAVAVAALAGCSPADDEPSTASPSRSPATRGETTSGAAPSTGSTERPGEGTEGTAVPEASVDLPTTPPLRDPQALAGHLRTAVAVVRDPSASAHDLRLAGRFEQRAARDLARGPRAVRRAVLGRLSGAVRARTAAHVEAAALLDAMTTPQPQLPEWRIVEPPPAEELLGLYRYAARRVGVPWQHLAAIHLVETRMGRIRGTSSAGALGPMQFLPSTWDLYGQGGDIENPRDAILAAARLLRANGAPGDMSEAVWHYNPSDDYVGAVLRYAQQLRRWPQTYRGYWHWQVLYRHERGTYLLDHGYPRVRARLLD